MLVTEVFVFKASASAWPKGKRLGSRSRLTSVRRHEIQMRHNSQFPTQSFQRTNPTGSRIQGKCRLQRCISNQHHVNIPVESIPGIPHHTTQNGFKSKRISPTLLTVDLIWKSGNVMDEHEQTTKPFNKLATKTSWAATWNPGTLKAFTPSAPMELSHRLMLVTEVFIFKASASAWPKGKRLGSRSRLTSVRRHEIQMRDNSQFPTPSFHRTNPIGFKENVVYRGAFPATYHANIPVESIPHQTTQKEFNSKIGSPTSLTVNKIWNLQIKCEGWAWANYKAFQKAGDENTMSSHLEPHNTKSLHSLNAAGSFTQVDACHRSVCLQSLS